MRVFFALWPPARCAAALAQWAAALAQETGGRATRVETVHLTLAFLGELDPARVEAAAAAARTVAGAPHRLPIERAAYWRHNRILWVGPERTPAPLEVLVRDLHGALGGAGFALERRPFAAHVTLLRKARAPQTLAAPPAVDWPVAEFRLVRSRTAAQGARYEVLERYALRRDA